jgi:hypothetical protein
MTPKHGLTPSERDDLINRYLQEAEPSVYKLNDGALVYISNETKQKGSVVVATIAPDGEIPKFAQYSAGPKRTIISTQPSSECSNRLIDHQPDATLARLKHATQLTNEEKVLALTKFLAPPNSRADTIELLREYFGERGVTFQSIDDPPVFLEANKEEITAARRLLIGKQITFKNGARHQFVDDLVIVNISCRSADRHISSPSISIMFGSADDHDHDFAPENFPICLVDSKKQKYTPSFNITPECMIFTGLARGETYTIAKLK